MPAPVAGIHAFLIAKTWMAGTSPAMTRTLIFLRMASERLFNNIARLERELAASRAEVARLTAQLGSAMVGQT